MNCCDARSALPLLLDGQLAADERTAAIEKAMACQQCRAELSALAQNDAVLRRALAAQAAAVPAGYFDDFWPRLAARLDDETSGGDAMRMSSGTGSDSGSADKPGSSSATIGQDVAGKPLGKDELSGLHEIKALAASTVARNSKERRAITEPGDPVGGLLGTGSHAALGNVVLPQPGKEVAPPKVRATSVSDADGVRAAPLVVPPKQGKTGLVLGAFGLLAAAAGVAFYLKGQQAADAGAARQAVNTAATPVAAEEAKPEPAVAALTPPSEAPGAPEGGAAAGAVPAPADEDADEESAKARGAKSGKAAPGDPVAAGKDRDKDAKEPKDKNASAKPGKDKPAAADAKDAPKEIAPIGAAKAEPRNEIDEIFGDKPAGEKKPAEAAGPALPEKLAQGDVKKGMGSIKARVQACYDQFKIPGTIKLKVKIETDGSVGSAEVVDAKFAGTDTGACVSSAVKTAKFPAVSGPPLVVSYPFILQ